MKRYFFTKVGIANNGAVKIFTEVDEVLPRTSTQMKKAIFNQKSLSQTDVEVALLTTMSQMGYNASFHHHYVFVGADNWIKELKGFIKW